MAGTTQTPRRSLRQTKETKRFDPSENTEVENVASKKARVSKNQTKEVAVKVEGHSDKSTRKKNTPPETINHLKDHRARLSFGITAKHMKELQKCTTFESSEKRKRDLVCDHFMFSFDQIVAKPYKYRKVADKSLKARPVAQTVFLIPPGCNKKALGKRLISVGNVLVDDRFDNTFDERVKVTSCATEYYQLLFGDNDPPSQAACKEQPDKIKVQVPNAKKTLQRTTRRKLPTKALRKQPPKKQIVSDLTNNTTLTLDEGGSTDNEDTDSEDETTFNKLAGLKTTGLDEVDNKNEDIDKEIEDIDKKIEAGQKEVDELRRQINEGYNNDAWTCDDYGGGDVPDDDNAEQNQHSEIVRVPSGNQKDDGGGGGDDNAEQNQHSEIVRVPSGNQKDDGGGGGDDNAEQNQHSEIVEAPSDQKVLFGEFRDPRMVNSDEEEGDTEEEDNDSTYRMDVDGNYELDAAVDQAIDEAIATLTASYQSQKIAEDTTEDTSQNYSSNNATLVWRIAFGLAFVVAFQFGVVYLLCKISYY